MTTINKYVNNKTMPKHVIFVKYTKLFVSSHFIPFNLLIWVKLVYLVTLMKLIIWKNKPSGHKNKRFLPEGKFFWNWCQENCASTTHARVTRSMLIDYLDFRKMPPRLKFFWGLTPFFTKMWASLRGRIQKWPSFSNTI